MQLSHLISRREALSLLGLASLTIGNPRARSAPPPKRNQTLSGFECFLRDHTRALKGKTIGLITNPTGLDSKLRSSASLLAHHPDLKVGALYGPEHGVRGDAQAGQYVAFFNDSKLNLPVFSLYGKSKKPEPWMLSSSARTNPSLSATINPPSAPSETSKIALSLDAMLFDIQDVGTRAYTYIATMAYAMQACAEQRIPFWVLDRPNPINGIDIEGPTLDYPALSSFVGLYPIPLRHGLTTGELARLFNDRFLKPKAELKIIPCQGWRRGQWFDATGLPWVMPSPNLPTLDSATVYPGQVLLEGTNVSEGRGTTRPFECFGAPWIDGFDLTVRLNALRVPGAAFRETWFTPTFSKFQGQRCGGSQIHITDRSQFRPVATALKIIQTIHRTAPDKFEFHPETFDKLIGTTRARLFLGADRDLEPLIAEFDAETRSFHALRRPYLLYRS